MLPRRRSIEMKCTAHPGLCCSVFVSCSGIFFMSTYCLVHLFFFLHWGFYSDLQKVRILSKCYLFYLFIWQQDTTRKNVSFDSDGLLFYFFPSQTSSPNSSNENSPVSPPDDQGQGDCPPQLEEEEPAFPHTDLAKLDDMINRQVTFQSFMPENKVHFVVSRYFFSLNF